MNTRVRRVLASLAGCASRRFSIALAILLAASLPMPASAQTAAPAPTPDRAQLERRLQSVATLIESSSAARQIESADAPAARERRHNARLLHREATAAFAAGELAQSAKLLDQAARELMAGTRQARPEQVAGEKARRDFDARMDSARALLAAQQRITAEKGATREAQDATRAIQRQIDEAQALAQQGRHDDARPVLDRAYLSARVSIESMRRGDTLVRSLHFANRQEEYDYEIDRNDTHRMLLGVVLAERATKPAGVQEAMESATRLRADAEARARAGDHGAGIRLLEDSTRELVRAIRAGGLFIPG